MAGVMAPQRVAPAQHASTIRTAAPLLCSGFSRPSAPGVISVRVVSTRAAAAKVEVSKTPVILPGQEKTNNPMNIVFVATGARWMGKVRTNHRQGSLPTLLTYTNFALIAEVAPWSKTGGLGDVLGGE